MICASEAMLRDIALVIIARKSILCSPRARYRPLDEVRSISPVVLLGHSNENAIAMDRKRRLRLRRALRADGLCRARHGQRGRRDRGLRGTRAATWRRCSAFYGAFFLANAASFFYTTRRGKFQVWDEILDGLHLRGDERVLDMGCGRGAVLTAVAQTVDDRASDRHRSVEHARSIRECPRGDDAKRGARRGE